MTGLPKKKSCPIGGGKTLSSTTGGGKTLNAKDNSLMLPTERLQEIAREEGLDPMRCPVFSGEMPFEAFLNKSGLNPTPQDGCPFMSVLDHRGETLPPGTVFKPNKHFRGTQGDMDDVNHAKEMGEDPWTIAEKNAEEGYKLRDVIRGVYYGWIWGDIARYIEAKSHDILGPKIAMSICGNVCGRKDIEEAIRLDEERKRKEALPKFGPERPPTITEGSAKITKVTEPSTIPKNTTSHGDKDEKPPQE